MKNILILILMFIGVVGYSQDVKLKYEYKADTTQTFTYDITYPNGNVLVVFTYYSTDGKEIRERQLFTPAEFQEYAIAMRDGFQEKQAKLLEWYQENQAKVDEQKSRYFKFRDWKLFWQGYIE